LALISAVLFGVTAALPAFAQDGEDEMVQPQVVGGSSVENGKYPFMVSLQYNRSGTTPRQDHFCGGTLIDPDSVLTAAHCARLVKNGTVPRRQLRVVVGTTVLNSGQGQVRKTSRVVLHPRFDYGTYAYDAAVLELDRPVNRAPLIGLLAPGANRPERVGRSAVVAGWGNTLRQSPAFSEPDNLPNRMQEAQVPIVSVSECGVYEPAFAPGVQVCAGRENRDTCQGDSGGPLFVTANGVRRQIGITSYGAGCGSRGYPGVYTEVNSTPIYNFIRREARR